MDEKFTKPWIVTHYTIETWNAMYNNAGKVEDALVSEYNTTYSDPTAQLNKDYNYMYHLVETGSVITDPELKKEVEDWNNGVVPPVYDYDEVIGHTLKLNGNSFVIAASYCIKLDNNETINNQKHTLVL